MIRFSITLIRKFDRCGLLQREFLFFDKGGERRDWERGEGGKKTTPSGEQIGFAYPFERFPFTR